MPNPNYCKKGCIVRSPTTSVRCAYCSDDAVGKKYYLDKDGTCKECLLEDCISCNN